ncbi:MAG: family 43 glycosylhydrolase [Clostridia bacterium]|nr:family 43 glycosylhydrolase [Clostridia bacterium]
MKTNEINIRDPFVLLENGTYYLYGTRGATCWGPATGFDVYTGTDLENWSTPREVFDSAAFGLNRASNWAPEVHRYAGKYYVFATFEQENGMRGTYALVSDSPCGPFAPVSGAALTPAEWWSLDGTLYVDRKGAPWLVFCHEHVQILNGTVCAVPLKADLSAPASEPWLLFSGHNAYGAVPDAERRYVTDGPFLYRGENDRLYMIWSTIVRGAYYQCLAMSDTGEIDGNWIQLPPVFTEDGGHGMVFRDRAGALRLVLHTPNISGCEHPKFFRLEDTGDRLRVIG